MKHSIISLLFITVFFGNSIIHPNDTTQLTPERQTIQEALEPINDELIPEFKNKEIQQNRLAQENTIFELEELLKKINEDIYVGMRQIHRDDKDEILSILKERKKEIKAQLYYLKQFLPHYEKDEKKGLSQQTMLLVAAGALASGGLLILALNHNTQPTT